MPKKKEPKLDFYKAVAVLIAKHGTSDSDTRRALEETQRHINHDGGASPGDGDWTTAC